MDSQIPLIDSLRGIETGNNRRNPVVVDELIDSLRGIETMVRVPRWVSGSIAYRLPKRDRNSAADGFKDVKNPAYRLPKRDRNKSIVALPRPSMYALIDSLRGIETERGATVSYPVAVAYRLPKRDRNRNGQRKEDPQPKAYRLPKRDRNVVFRS